MTLICKLLTSHHACNYLIMSMAEKICVTSFNEDLLKGLLKEIPIWTAIVPFPLRTPVD